MRLAVVIVAHAWPAQVARLVGRIWSPDVRVLLHIDAGTADEVQRDIAGRLEGVPGLELLPRIRSPWGSRGVLLATLEGARAAVSGPDPADYVLLASGQDYPLMTTDALIERLEAAEGASFIEHFRLPDPRWASARGGLARYEDRWLAMPRRTVRVRGRRRLPRGFEPHGGATWWCLARPHAEYLLATCDATPRLLQMSRSIRIPDEFVPQTVLGSSPHRERIVDRCPTYVVWPNATARHPVPIGLEHLDAGQASGAFLARKFVAPDGRSDVLDELDRRLGPPRQEVVHLGSYSESIAWPRLPRPRTRVAAQLDPTEDE